MPRQAIPTGGRPESGQADVACEEAGRHGLPGGSETILIVDDESSIRRLLRRQLAPLGYRVLEAGDGIDAWTVASRYRGVIDLLVSDVMMPHLRGFALAHALTAIRPELRVLLLTGYARDEWVRTGLRGGAAYLTKPFSAAQLARKVRELLDVP